MTTYTVVHTVEGELSDTMYQVTKAQLTDPAWIQRNIFNWMEYLNDEDQGITNSIISAIEKNPDSNMFIFTGDAGHIFIFKTGLTKHYETISL